MPPVWLVDPIMVRLTSVGGVVGLHDDDEAEAFDYACSLARAEAIDRLLLSVIDDRGWELSEQRVLDRVTVDHDGKTRARILIDGQPVTPWWEDRLATEGSEMTWHFEVAAGAGD